MTADRQHDRRLGGTTVIVTGASSGIGRAIAVTVARHGANVVMADVRDVRGRIMPLLGRQQDVASAASFLASDEVLRHGGEPRGGRRVDGQPTRPCAAVVGGTPSPSLRGPYAAGMPSSTAPDTPFTGFGPAVTDWFVALASDDSRAFWHATRDVWQRDVRSPLEALLDELAAEVGGRVKLFRPYRDMRYASADAGPIKPQAGGLVRTAESASARYVEVSIEGFYAGRGMYRFERDQLERYRAAALAPRSGERLAALLARAEADGLEVGGDALKTAPRGVSRDHPRVALLRRKGLFLGGTVPPGPALETTAPRDHARRVWAATDDVIAWLDAQVGPSELPRDGRR